MSDTVPRRHGIIPFPTPPACECKRPRFPDHGFRLLLGPLRRTDVASFAEKCVVPVDAQAIAYIGNAAFGYRASSASFPRIFYRQLLQDGIHDLGRRHRRGTERTGSTPMDGTRRISCGHNEHAHR